MKTSEWVILLMALGIILIIGSNFIKPVQLNKLQLKLVNEKAIKMNLDENNCIYKLNFTILNEGKDIDNAKAEIKIVKNKQTIEVDDLNTGEIRQLETKTFQRNYTRPCNYLDGFNISFSRE